MYNAVVPVIRGLSDIMDASLSELRTPHAPRVSTADAGTMVCGPVIAVYIAAADQFSFHLSHGDVNKAAVQSPLLSIVRDSE